MAEELRVLEILKEKEEEFERLLEGTRKDARRIIEEARERAKEIESSFYKELDSLKDDLTRDEERLRIERIKEIKGETQIVKEELKEKVKNRKEDCIQLIIDMVCGKHYPASIKRGGGPH